MIITKEMMEAVKPFAEQSAPTSLILEREQIMITKLLDRSAHELKVFYSNVHRIKGIYLASELFSVRLYSIEDLEKRFAVAIPAVHADSLQLSDLRSIGILSEKIINHLAEIHTICHNALPFIDKFKASEKARESLRWCYTRAQRFFDLYSVNGEVDTEEVLKKHWKISISSDDRPFYVTNIASTKKQAFKTIRDVFEHLYQAYQDVLKNVFIPYDKVIVE